MSLSGGTAYVDVALGKSDDLAKGISDVGGQAADTAKSSFLSRIGTMAIGGALGNALTSGVSSAVDFAKDSVIGFNSELQQASIGFTTMLGSSQAAGAYIQQLQTFAKTTPFQFGDLVSQAQQMMGMGISAKAVIPDLTALGDSVASIGGSASQVDSVTLAFDQMNAKGTLDMGNMNQLMQNGVPSALKILAASYKVTTGEMITMISSGKVQSDVALPALVQGLEKGTTSTAALGGMMAKQSLTMGGALSNVKDSATQAMAGAFKPVFDASSAAVQGLANVLGSGAITRASKAISDGLTSTFGGVKSVIKDVRDGWANFDDLLGNSTGFTALGATLHQGYGDLENIAIGFKHAYDYGGPAGSTFEAIGQQAKFLFDKAQPLASEVFGKIQDSVQTLGPVLKELFLDKVATIKTVVGDAIPIVENIVRVLGPVLGEVLKSGADLVVNHLVPAFMKISAFVQQDVIPAVMNFVAFAVQHLLPIFQEVGDVISQKVAPEISKLVDLFVAKVLPALKPLIDNGFALLKNVISELTPIVEDLVHWFADNVLPVLSKLADFLVGTLIPFIAQVANVIVVILKPAFDIVIGIVRDVVIPIFKMLADIYLGLESTGISVANGIISAIHGIADVFSWLKDTTKAVFDWITGIWGDQITLVKGIPAKLEAAGAGMWDWVKSTFKGVLDTVIGWWNDLQFSTPKIHIPGTPSSWDIGPYTIGLPHIPPLAAGGLVLPSPGGTVVRVAEAGVPEIVAPAAAIEAAVSRALGTHRGTIGRDSPLIGTVNMPPGISADTTAELLYGKLISRGMAV